MEIANVAKEYHRGLHLAYSCQYHVIFCPKYRRPILVGPVKERLGELIKRKCRELNTKMLDMVIRPDHVHLLLDADPSIGIYKIVAQIKNHTASVLRIEFPDLRSKLPSLWTHKKFIATAGVVDLKIVHQYLEDQKNV